MSVPFPKWYETKVCKQQLRDLVPNRLPDHPAIPEWTPYLLAVTDALIREAPLPPLPTTLTSVPPTDVEEWREVLSQRVASAREAWEMNMSAIPALVNAEPYFRVPCEPLSYFKDFFNSTASNPKPVAIAPDRLDVWESFEDEARAWRPPFEIILRETWKRKKVTNEARLDNTLEEGYNQILRAVFGDAAATTDGDEPAHPYFEIVNAAGSPPIETNPDHVLQHVNINDLGKEIYTPLFLFESKRAGVLKKLPTNLPITACYDKPGAPALKGTSNVRNALEQLLGYLSRSRVQYGLLTSFDQTYIVRRRSGTWSVSRAILANSSTTATSVSWRRAVGFAWSLALAAQLPQDGAPPPPFPTWPEPDGPAGGDEETAGAPKWRKQGSHHGQAGLEAGEEAGGEGQAEAGEEAGEGEQAGGGDADSGIGTPTLLRLLRRAELDWDRNQFLGSGATGRAYRGAFHGDPAVIKFVDLFKVENAESIVYAEIEAYGALEDLQGSAIPLFYGGGNLWGAGVVAVEEVKPGKLEGVEGWEDLSPVDQNLARASLKRIHAKGYIHGDVRWENLLFAESEGVRRAVWIDLGRARRAAGWEIADEEETFEWVEATSFASSCLGRKEGPRFARSPLTAVAIRPHTFQRQPSPTIPFQKSTLQKNLTISGPIMPTIHQSLTLTPAPGPLARMRSSKMRPTPVWTSTSSHRML
ncbi:hypothetical protein BDK51DRAFT_27371, partial [Blyttiomyces helicus]